MNTPKQGTQPLCPKPERMKLRDAVVEVCKVNGIPHEPIAAALDEGMETDPIINVTFSQKHPRAAALDAAKRYVTICMLPDDQFRHVVSRINQEQTRQAALN